MDLHEERPAAPRGVLRIGRVLGFPLFLSPSWLVLAVVLTIVYADGLPTVPALVGHLLGLGFVGCLLGSVLLHELGHALVGRRLGLGVRCITLELLGGYTELDRDAAVPRDEALVSLAGPAASLVLAVLTGGAAVVAPEHSLAAHMLGQVAMSNLVVAVFNALPGLPLDGGRALQAAVWAGTGDPHRGRLIAGWTGRAVAVAAVVGGVAIFADGSMPASGFVFGLLVLLIAGTIWQGATTAVRLGRSGARLHLLAVDGLTRPIFRVPGGTPLAEARRRAAEAGRADAVLVVVDSDDRLRAIVHEAAAAAVPPERQAWVSIDDVARGIDPARAVPAGLRGSDVLRAVQADPVGEYLVTSGKDVVGILRVADLIQILEPRRSNQ